jgi:hypothetical protein
MGLNRALLVVGIRRSFDKFIGLEHGLENGLGADEPDEMGDVDRPRGIRCRVRARNCPPRLRWSSVEVEGESGLESEAHHSSGETVGNQFGRQVE